MVSGRNRARRKKRISKHVLKNREQKQMTKSSPENGSEKGEVRSTSNHKSGTNEVSLTSATRKDLGHTKDPLEAASYLSSWQHRESGCCVWKFNKNTQSWLLRHMYNVNLVTKSTFDCLVEYIDGIKGVTISRILQDATERALRYKEWDENNQSHEGTEGSISRLSQSSNKELEGNTHVDAKGVLAQQDTVRWLSLNSHEKRKEYKRARRIIETLQQEKANDDKS